MTTLTLSPALTSTKARRHRKLGVEALESRLNLSTLTTLATPTAPQTTGLPSTSISATTTSSSAKLIPITDGIIAGSDADPFKDVRLGATNISSTGTTAIDASAYYSISNAKLESQGGINDIGYMQASGSSVSYVLNVAAAGTYTLSAKTATTSWATMGVSVNGGSTASFGVNGTGAWSTFGNTTGSIYLPSGTVTLTIKNLNNTIYNLGTISLTAPAGSTTTTTTTGGNTVGSSLTLTADKYSAISNASIETQANGMKDVANMQASGSSVTYTLNVSTAGTYNLSALTATPSWGTMGVSVNGAANVVMGVNGTGGWTNFSATTGSVYLPTGTVTLKISNLNNQIFNLGTITLTNPSATTAPVTTPVTTPTTPTTPTTTATGGTLGSSLAITANNYSAISNAKVETQGNGMQDIGYMQASGSSVTYTINVTTAGTYNLQALTASPAWAAMGVSVNGGAAQEFDMNATGAWTTFKSIGGNVYLPTGTVTLKFSNLYGTIFNLGTINLTAAGTTTPVTTPTTPTTPTTTTAGTLGTSALAITADKYSAISNAKVESQANGMQDVGYMQASGSSVTYTINVTSAGTYNLQALTSSPAWAAMGVSVNGGSAQEFDMNASGGWTTFKSIGGNLYLPSGTVTLKVSNLYGTIFNLGTLTLATPGSTTTTTTPPPTTTPTTPQSPQSWSSGGVTVTTNWMTSFNQLTITGTSGNDNIAVSKSGSTITVVANGATQTFTGTYGTIVVKGLAGNDSITINSSVNIATAIYGGDGNNTLTDLTTGKATIVAIGNGYDSLTGNGSNTSYWADAGDTVNASTAERNAGRVHTVTSFYNGVSTSLAGQNLSDPSGTGTTTRLTANSFWGTGPSMTDVAQGLVSDCYLVGALQTLAYSNPSRLQELGVDLGDGTYAIEFQKGGTTTYVRVDGDLPSSGPYASGLKYAHPGASGNEWVPLFEKAYAEFGTGGWSYASLNEGWFGTALANFGFVGTSFSYSNASALYGSIAGALASGKGVTIGTTPSTGGIPLIGDHTYTVTAAFTSGGVQYVTVRNPWGYDGAGNDGNTGDGLVTLTVSSMTPFLIGAVAV